jgi:hypothetical protein
MAEERDGMIGDPQAKLETALIDEYLREHGIARDELRHMPPEEYIRNAKEASAYATARLTEVETRAHYVHEIHGAAPVATPRPKRRQER